MTQRHARNMERAARNEATGRAAMATLSVTKMEA
jgi:hypothetical protein